MAEVIKGALEDHLGRVIHPDTEADQVLRPNGETAEAALERIFALFQSFLALSGGTVNGNLATSGTFTVNQWCGISAGSDGAVVIAENAYKHHANNTFHFARTHESMGARGIVLRGDTTGIWYFDTGNRATTADEQFTPTLISMTDKSTILISGKDMNEVVENGIYNGNGMINAPYGGWFWVQVINHNLDTDRWQTQIAYSFSDNNTYRRTKSDGTWSAWEWFLTNSNSPALHYATWEPLATDGKEGDVWDIYV